MAEHNRTKRPRSNSDLYHDLALRPATRQRLESLSVASSSVSATSTTVGSASTIPPQASFAPDTSSSTKPLPGSRGAAPISAETTSTNVDATPPGFNASCLATMRESETQAMGPACHQLWHLSRNPSRQEEYAHCLARFEAGLQRQIQRMQNQLQLVQEKIRHANEKIEQLQETNRRLREELQQRSRQLIQQRNENQQFRAENHWLKEDAAEMNGRMEFDRLRMSGAREAEARLVSGYFAIKEDSESCDDEDEEDEDQEGDYYTWGY
ncbi:hypothetical protein QBC40DRAFT_260265 [Triangularia verruculosa]|uniref:Uncharacterized protein n=1 Tax=Triangularia verruculosa TaxID=2587418 RepID=A0AAN7AQR4_9PEZI|nr:hypothetical protein QBC40DRAFT_260265 [Triangularia verruculosa]